MLTARHEDIQAGQYLGAFELSLWLGVSVVLAMWSDRIAGK
jgi:hypothetical protein